VQHGHELYARIHGAMTDATVCPDIRNGDSAGTAIPFCAAFLGAGQRTTLAQILQKGDGGMNVRQADGPSVEKKFHAGITYGQFCIQSIAL
jgi:hypothetical protein